jgi:hypothetical protein
MRRMSWREPVYCVVGGRPGENGLTVRWVTWRVPVQHVVDDVASMSTLCGGSAPCPSACAGWQALVPLDLHSAVRVRSPVSVHGRRRCRCWRRRCRVLLLPLVADPPGGRD